MVSPTPYPGALPYTPTPAAIPEDRRGKTGALFTLALFRAGRCDPPCEACVVLRQIIAEMERQLETVPDAGAGSPPQ